MASSHPRSAGDARPRFGEDLLIVREAQLEGEAICFSRSSRTKIILAFISEAK